MRCLVIGAYSYIGSHLVAALRQLGHEVVQAVRTNEGIDFDQKIVFLDLTDKLSIDKISWNFDIVYLFSGRTGTSASFTNYNDFVLINEIGLLNILDAIAKSKYRPKIIFPSSRLVYKGSNHILNEQSTLEANTVYAANKIACEYLLSAYAKAYSIPYFICRIGVPYGNTLSSEYSYGTIGTFFKHAQKNSVINLYGDGTYRRTFTYIESLCEVLICLGLKEKETNLVFNLPGEDLSLIEVAKAIAEKFCARVEFKPWPDFDEKIESGSTVFDTTLYENMMGYKYNYSFKLWLSSL